jgi:hypothetical protein
VRDRPKRNYRYQFVAKKLKLAQNEQKPGKSKKTEISRYLAADKGI